MGHQQNAIRWRRSFGPPPIASFPTGAEPRRRASDFPSADAALPLLQEAQAEHPLWNSGLFRACAEGTLSREDFQFIFSQYYLYSKNFTRCLAGVMANCDNDYYRARLSENLWDEGGGEKPERRHTEIFRGFIHD